MRGRKPKPDHMKAAAGNPGRRKLAPKPSSGTAPGAAHVAVPKWLTAEAKRLWRGLAPELERFNVLQQTDAAAFGRYCTHMATWLQASRTIEDEGAHYDATTVAGEQLKRLHPAVKVRELAEKHLVELEDRFGLTPAARIKLLRERAAQPNGGLFDLMSSAAAGVPAPAGSTAEAGGGAADAPGSAPPPPSPIGFLGTPRLN